MEKWQIEREPLKTLYSVYDGYDVNDVHGVEYIYEIWEVIILVLRLSRARAHLFKAQNIRHSLRHVRSRLYSLQSTRW